MQGTSAKIGKQRLAHDLELTRILRRMGSTKTAVSLMLQPQRKWIDKANRKLFSVSAGLEESVGSSSEDEHIMAAALERAEHEAMAENSLNQMNQLGESGNLFNSAMEVREDPMQETMRPLNVSVKDHFSDSKIVRINETESAKSSPKSRRSRASFGSRLTRKSHASVVMEEPSKEDKGFSLKSRVSMRSKSQKSSGKISQRKQYTMEANRTSMNVISYQNEYYRHESYKGPRIGREIASPKSIRTNKSLAKQRSRLAGHSGGASPKLFKSKSPNPVATKFTRTDRLVTLDQPESPQQRCSPMVGGRKSSITHGSSPRRKGTLVQVSPADRSMLQTQKSLGIRHVNKSPALRSHTMKASKSRSPGSRRNVSIGNQSIRLSQIGMKVASPESKKNSQPDVASLAQVSSARSQSLEKLPGEEVDLERSPDTRSPVNPRYHITGIQSTQKTPRRSRISNMDYEPVNPVRRKMAKPHDLPCLTNGKLPVLRTSLNNGIDMQNLILVGDPHKLRGTASSIRKSSMIST